MDKRRAAQNIYQGIHLHLGIKRTLRGLLSRLNSLIPGAPPGSTANGFDAISKHVRSVGESQIESVLPKRISLRDLPDGFRFPAKVLSPSMEPHIRTNRVVWVQKTIPAYIALGDVVVFRVPGRPVLFAHRVIRIHKQGQRVRFMTRGDNTPRPDHYMPSEKDIIGTVLVPKPLYWRIRAKIANLKHVT